ncbi:Crp/Fnr family transcriptional regulator [Allomuricauda sp. NBRC 101325]|uniref:Crp/Fnr family transcriptional regulator n=1 Tax=Allomuricauda sp. NBRC 101325 TaxID=1113758 RepID=UPI0024A54607|nr:Crp/Fnr family transcriptional regulator [Muricauda sp. NBRC 101325]GLU44372.1 cAMP-binding protein [Muricauda sp. NBRC 101325]
MKSHLLAYSHFTEEEIAKVLYHFEEKKFKKRDLVIEAGHVDSYQYFITQGCVRGYIVDYNGKEHNIAFGFEEFWFGDMESFTNNTKAHYNYQALEDLTVLAISKSNWDKISNEVPAFIEYSRNLFRNAMIFQQNRIAKHLMQTAEQRYEQLIYENPKVLQRISLKNIASYLGVTPEFISILRKKAAQK